MKTLILFILSVFLLISCGKTVKDNDNNLKKHKNTGIISILPQNTEAIIDIKSISSVYKNFKISENSAFGQKITETDTEDIKKILGLNPLNIKKLEETGIDINRNLGISFSGMKINKNFNDMASLNTIIYIPLKNKKTVLSYIDSRFKDGKLAEYDDKNLKLNYKKENNYIKFSGEKKDEVIYITVKNNYLLIIFNPFSPESSFKLLNDIINNKTTFKNSATYQEMSKISGKNNGIYVYGDIESFILENKEKILKELTRDSKIMADIIQSYQAVSMQVILDKKDFTLNFSAKMKSGRILSILEGVKYNNSTIIGLEKNPLLILSLGLNIKAYASLIKDIMKEYMEKSYNIDKKLVEEETSIKNNKSDESDKTLKNEIDKLSKKFGFDIEKDLIDNFDGNFSFATYEGMSISTTNYNSVMTIGFKNIKTAETVIDKLLENKEFQKLKNFVNKTIYKGKPVYIINAMVTQIYVGLRNNEIIIASGKNIYDAALLSKKTTGFYKYSERDTKLVSATKSDMIFYISFLEIIKALGNFKAMIEPQKLQKIQDKLELLDYFLIKANLKGNIFTSEYTLKTNYQDLFFITLIDTITKENNTEKKAETSIAPVK